MKLFILIPLFLACFISETLFANQQENKRKKTEIAVTEFILAEKSLELYREMSSDDREIWSERFWRSMDPTPTTEKNEYYTEFLQRVEFAIQNYHNLVAPYYVDDLGRYYIKYGQPDDHSESSGIGKSYKDNITWVYYNYNLFIDFVDFTGYGYREVGDLTEAVSGAPFNERVRIAKQLYMERTNLSQKYLSFRNVRNDIDYFGDAQELTQEKQIALQAAPPATYHFEHEAEPLTLKLASSVFRDQDKRSRLELYYSIPLRELKFNTSNSGIQITNLEKSIQIFDANYFPLIRRNETIPLQSPTGTNLEFRSYVNQHNEELIPGMYHLALQFKNPESGRTIILKSQLNIRDFSSRDITISDVQFARQILINPEGKYLKPNNLQVVPYISSIIKKNRPIMIYFEIYNLALENNKSKFQVEYRIKDIKKEGNFVIDTAAKIANFFRKDIEPSSTGTVME